MRFRHKAKQCLSVSPAVIFSVHHHLTVWCPAKNIGRASLDKMLAQKTWGHVMRMISFLILVMMFVGSSSLADPISAVQEPSISAAGIGFSDPRIKRSPDWEIGVPNFSWLVNFGATEMPATHINLRTAVEEGNLENVKKLIARGLDVNDNHGEALMLAAKYGHLEVVKYLLEAGAHPDGTDAMSINKGRVLQYAAMNNHLDIVNVLLDAGATVEMQSHGGGLLTRAADNGHLEVVQRLLEAGADPNSGRGYSLLGAAKAGHLDVVNAFIEAGANVSSYGGYTMRIAAKEGHLEVVKALIKGGVKSEEYGGPLRAAATNGHADIVKLILGSGADPIYHYLLLGAVDEGHLDVVNAFIDAGANVSAYGGAAMTAAAANGHLDIVKLMLEMGTDPSYGQVLKSAANFGDLEVVRTLLEAGSKITYDDDIGSPLHSAVYGGHPEVVALLVEYGADIKRPLTKDHSFDIYSYNYDSLGNGWTVMHEAARWGQTMIEKLVALGADINVQDVRGRTPLMVAIYNKRVITAKEMLRFCADLTLTDNQGKTALDLAKAVASENETDSSESRDLMNLLMEALPEKIASSPYNGETQSALREEYLTMIEADSISKGARFLNIYPALRYLFEERGRQGVTKIIEDHNCKMSMLEKGTIAMGTEYLARCQCVPGQGPQMTFIPVIQDGNLCGQRTTVQEASASDAAAGLAVDSAAAVDLATAMDSAGASAATGASAVAAAEAQI